MKGAVSMLSLIPRDIAKATMRLEITLIVEETESLQSSMPLKASEFVKLYLSSLSASNIRFSLNNRQISPSRSISVIPRRNNSNQASKKQLDKPRRMCMCSPTSHPDYVGKVFDEMLVDDFWYELKAIRWYPVSVDPPLTGLPWLVPDNTCSLELHGFARNRLWSVDNDSPPFPTNPTNNVFIDLIFKSTEDDLKTWPHK
ncbi:unnamed protein product [Lactuca saligna]|uniref:Uncharacterized protein n=1 Tax=Lactuca saligna TaxID=75948 RepID=A0AA36E7C3_LACSI|nr:unnamed protein product [Lactuca saligna]